MRSLSLLLFVLISLSLPLRAQLPEAPPALEAEQPEVISYNSGKSYAGEAPAPADNYKSATEEVNKFKAEHSYFRPKPASEKKQESPSNNSWDFNWAALSSIKWLLLALVIGLLAFVLYRILISGWKRNVKIKQVAFQVLEEVDERLKEDNTLEAQLEKALQQRNFRLAIRIQYLLCLRQLARAEKIQLQKGKTNREYAAALNDNVLRNAFNKLCLHYEYVNFSDEPLQEEQLKANFNQIVSYRQNMEGRL